MYHFQMMISQFLGQFHPSFTYVAPHGASRRRGLPRYGDAIAMVQRCLELEPSHYDAKMLMQDLDRLVTSEQPSGHGWTMVDHGDDR